MCIRDRALVSLHQVGHRKLPEGGTVDHQHVGLADDLQGLGQQVQVIGLFLEDNGRADLVPAHVYVAVGDVGGAVGDVEEVRCV